MDWPQRGERGLKGTVYNIKGAVETASTATVDGKVVICSLNGRGNPFCAPDQYHLQIRAAPPRPGRREGRARAPPAAAILISHLSTEMIKFKMSVGGGGRRNGLFSSAVRARFRPAPTTPSAASSSPISSPRYNNIFVLASRIQSMHCTPRVLRVAESDSMNI